MARNKIFIILSSKSSGSSALQNYMSANFGVRIIPHSTHHEHETLFWTKAASILSLPQNAMHRSEVPIPAEKSVKGLAEFLAKNNVTAGINVNTKREQFFELFYQLCVNTGFPVIEKSPHHLFNYSNVELILDFKKYISDRAEVVLLGLVRNPLDTVYSGWSRWRFNCDAFAREWFVSYRNMQRLTQDHKDIRTFRYEDVTRSSQELDNFLTQQCQLPKKSADFTFNDRSLHKWKKDTRFEFAPSEEVIKMAKYYRYEKSELSTISTPSLSWRLRELLYGVKFQLSRARKALK